MNIIIPLGGKGERFYKEEFNKPKPIIFHVIDRLVI